MLGLPQAAVFNGANSKFNLPVTPVFSSFTLSTWVYFNSVGAVNDQHIFRIAPTTDQANVDLYLRG